MEQSLLYNLPRTDFLDTFFLFFTKLPGAVGQLWLILGVAVGYAAVRLCDLAAKKKQNKQVG